MKSGSVTELGPGRFWARGPRPERLSLGVWPTREEAEEVRAAAVQELARADRTRVAGVTLRAFATRHVDEREIDGERSTPQRRAYLAHIFAAPFADDPIDEPRRPAVVAWIKKLKKAKVRKGRGEPHTIARAYVRAIVGLLSQIYDAALEEGLLEANSARGHRIRSQKRLEHDEDEGEVWTYLDAAEQRAIITCETIPETDRLTIAFAIGTGLRLGEQTNLELRDLRVDGPEPHVVVRWGSKGRRPKNGKIRTVPLFGLALDAARRWLELLPSFAPKNPLDLVFPTARGFRRRKPLHRGKRNAVDGFRLALDAAGIVRRVRWHDLRHTCASSLVAGWWGERWSLQDVKELLGHTSVRITERYAHLAPAVVTALAARTAGLQPGDGGPPPLRAAPVIGRSDRAVEGAAAPSSCWATSPATISRTSVVHHPAITREHAIEGLRALARGDVAAAALLALGMSEAELCQHFEAALDHGVAGAAPIAKGRR